MTVETAANVRMPHLPPPEDLEATWNYIEAGIRCLLELDLSGGVSADTYMKVYTAIHNFCVSHRQNRNDPLAASRLRGAQLQGADLYQRLDNYLKSHLTSLYVSSLTHHGDQLVRLYNSYWDRYMVGAKLLNHIFEYLNRHWVRRERDEGNRDCYEVYTLCLVRWRTQMFDPVQEKLVRAVLKQIQQLRDRQLAANDEVRRAVQSFVWLGLDENNQKKQSLKVYTEFFEGPFLEATKDYYMAESDTFLASNSVVDYLKKAQIRLRDEASLAEMYLHPSTEIKLTDAIDETLIARHIDKMHGEFANLLADDREDDYSRMFELVSRIPDGLKPMEIALEEYVERQGLAAVNELKASLETGEGKRAVDPKDYVETLLAVHVKYSEIVHRAFKSNTDLVKSFDRGCKRYMNHNSIAGLQSGRSKTAELMARYCDALLKKSSKAAEDTDIDARLTGVMSVFQYVDEKDAFETFYSRLLSKRLVFGTSASEDVEINMVARLKESCGYEYTNKLQRMFNDMTTSAEMQTKFRDSVDKAYAAIEFQPFVLAETFWPLPTSKSKLKLPHELASTYDRFQGFYGEQHRGRKLTWLWNFGKGELKMNFANSSRTGYLCTVSAYQMAILLAYNDRDSYSMAELEDITSLDKDVLWGSLTILVRARVLLQTPESDKDGRADTTFALNFGFKNKKVRFNLNLPLKTEIKQDSEEVIKTIEEDRKLFLQAVIVRIMKARKELRHVQLVQETIEQSKKRFTPKIPEIKKCIDSLIDKDYLQRTDGNKYQYLA